MCWLNKTKRLLANFPKTSALALGCLSVAALPPYYLLPLLAAAFGGLMFLLLASPSPKKPLPSAIGSVSAILPAVFSGSTTR